MTERFASKEYKYCQGCLASATLTEKYCWKCGGTEFKKLWSLRDDPVSSPPEMKDCFLPPQGYGG
jgi:hypothetical protein